MHSGWRMICERSTIANGPKRMAAVRAGWGGAGWSCAGTGIFSLPEANAPRAHIDCILDRRERGVPRSDGNAQGGALAMRTESCCPLWCIEESFRRLREF
jgi:hypothetical protein